MIGNSLAFFLALSSSSLLLLSQQVEADVRNSSSRPSSGESLPEKKHLLFGFKDRDGMEQFDTARHRILKKKKLTTNHGDDETAAAAATRTSYPVLQRVNAMKLEVDDDELKQLLDDQGDNVLYYEEDSLVYPLGGEITPYGVQLVQAKKDFLDQLTSPPGSSISSTGDCNDANSFKVGIIDSGVDAGHPDIPCRNAEYSDNCVGAEFGLFFNERWYEPTDIHGTHVMGTIAALRGNGEGIQGILPGQNTCFIIARVFGGSVENARLSDILEAVEWVVNKGANVMNLSLGGAMFSITANALYSNIRNAGALVISASGNDGSSTRSYPASYSSVLSVGAVDAKGAHADFSQHNDQVDLVAPGAGILSTVPRGLGSITTVAVEGTDVAVSGSVMANSVLPPQATGVSGTLVNCPNLGSDTCLPPSGSFGGHICIIERGEITFEVKALNCERGGGVAAVIYNNIEGVVAGTLETPTQVNIPVVGLSRDDGIAMLERVGDTVSLNSQDGYGYSDGTSFASPHVVGVASAVWQACGASSCTVEEVLYCLEDTALDLGYSGKDNYFGHGLVQLKGSYDCLVNDVQCCSSAGPPVSTGQPDPTPAAPQLDCASSESAYQLCFITDLNSDEAADCRSCVNERIPYSIFGSSCSYLQNQLCPAIHDYCADCAPCTDKIEFYLGCAIQDIKGCGLDCDGTGSSNGPRSSPDSNGNVYNNPVPLPSFSQTNETGVSNGSTCTNALQDMNECFVLNEAGIAPTSLKLLSGNSTSGDESQSCKVCVESALSKSDLAGDSCDGVHEALCPAIHGCAGCEMCQMEIQRVLACHVHTETQGSCEVECQDPSAIEGSNGSTSGGNSLHGLGAIVFTGVLCLLSWVL